MLFCTVLLGTLVPLSASLSPELWSQKMAPKLSILSISIVRCLCLDEAQYAKLRTLMPFLKKHLHNSSYTVVLRRDDSTDCILTRGLNKVAIEGQRCQLICLTASEYQNRDADSRIFVCSPTLHILWFPTISLFLCLLPFF